MKIILCSACDVPKLAEMNKYLIEDEKVITICIW